MTEPRYNFVEGKRPCPCGSGKKFKRCCGSKAKDERKTWIYDHPKNPDLWDVLAISREHAKASFHAKWEEKRLLGQLKPHWETFEEGLIYLDGEKPEEASEEVRAERAELDETENDPSEAWKDGAEPPVDTSD